MKLLAIIENKTKSLKSYFHSKVISIFLLFSIFSLIKSLPKFFDFKYPSSFILNNENIFLVSSSDFIIYDQEFQEIKKIPILPLDYQIKQKSENEKVNLVQFSNEEGNYILVILKNVLYCFSQDGDLLLNIDLKDDLELIQENEKEIIHYDLLTYKKEGEELHFLLTFSISNKKYTKNSPFVNVIYYTINTSKKSLNKKFQKLLLLYSSYEYEVTYSQVLTLTSEISCSLMHENINVNSLLVCFYETKTYSKIKNSFIESKIHATGFDLDDFSRKELTSIEGVEFQDEKINYIKGFTFENQFDKTFLCYYNSIHGLFCLYYNINENQFYEQKRVALKRECDSEYLSSNFNFFYSNQEFVISCLKKNILSFVTLDKNFKSINKEKIDLQKIINNKFDLNLFSIIYLSNVDEYSILTDYDEKEKSKKTGLFILNNYDSQKQKLSKSKKRQLQTNLNEACGNMSDTCTSKGKCFGSCNEDKKYYRVQYNNSYKDEDECVECIEVEVGGIDHFYLDTDEILKPCYEKCLRCNQTGDGKNNSCNKCEIDYIPRPIQNSKEEPKPPYNCVRECSFSYYFTDYGQYKCSNSSLCTTDAPFRIEGENKCTDSCKLEDLFLHNGKCLKECPSGTENNTNNECEYKEESEELKGLCILDSQNLDLEARLGSGGIESLAKIYIDSYREKYDKNYISYYENELFRIAIFENPECVKDKGLDVSSPELGSCGNEIKRIYGLQNNVIVETIKRYDSNNHPYNTFYFFHPTTGTKIEDVTEICANYQLEMKNNVEEQLKNSGVSQEQIDRIKELAEQGIDVFDNDNKFYSDICVQYAIHERDVAIKDRIRTISPNLTLCDEGCESKGVNLTTMTSICTCNLDKIMSNNIITDNALVGGVIEEAKELISQSNLLVLQCYKDLFKKEKFIICYGAFIVFGLVFFQFILTMTFCFVGMPKLQKYYFDMGEFYLKNISSKSNEGNNKVKNKSKDIFKKSKKKHDAPPKKESSNGKRKSKLKNSQNNDISSATPVKSFKKGSNYSNVPIMDKYTDEKNGESYFNGGENDGRGRLPKNDEYDMEEYLATAVEDMDYDDAIKKDKRTFCNYFADSLKDRQIFFNTFISVDHIKPRSIKIILFLLNVDLYFLVNGLFYSEDYVSEVYHLYIDDEGSIKKDVNGNEIKEGFFDFVTRSVSRFLYSILVSIVLGYIIDCFFVEEKKIKGIFLREKDNSINLKSEIAEVTRNIKKRYSIFIGFSFFVLLLSFYDFSCFNNVYVYMKIEWIKSSLMIIIIMQVVSVLIVFLETSIRFMSFSCKSEKLYKLSKWLN